MLNQADRIDLHSCFNGLNYWMLRCPQVAEKLLTCVLGNAQSTA